MAGRDPVAVDSAAAQRAQSPPLVSLVLLNYNGLKFLGSLLRECFNSIVKTDYPNFEIIFVDNGSTDGSDAVAREFFEEAKDDRIRKIGFIKIGGNIIATGYNEGIKSSEGKYVAMLSNDIVYDPEWLKSIIDVMEKDSAIGIAGCKRYVYGTAKTIDGLGGNLCLDGRPIIPGHLRIDTGQFEVPEEMDWIGGAAVVRREVFEKIGLLDADYVIFYEDTDFCYRARKNGYRVIYVPQARLWHRTTSTIDNALSTQQRDYMGERSRIRFVMIHFTLPRVFSTFFVDLFAWFAVDSKWKTTFVRAYWWNFLNLNATLMRRFEIGPSPPYGCKRPLFSFSVSNFVRKISRNRRARFILDFEPAL